MSQHVFVVAPAWARRAVVGGASALALAPPSSAQVRAGFEAGAGMRLGGTAAQRTDAQRTLGGALRLDRPFASVEANAGLRDTGRTWLVDAGLRMHAATPAWRGVRWTVGGDVRHATDAGRLPVAFRGMPLGVLDRADGAPAWTTTATTRLSYAWRRSGAWIGADAAYASGADSTPGTARLGIGLWHQLREATIALRVGSRSARLGGRAATLQPYVIPITRTDTVRFGDTLRLKLDTVGYQTRTRGDSAIASQVRRWSEVEMQLAWAHGHFALDGVVGGRPRIGTRADTASVLLAPMVWAHASGSVVVGARVALVGGVGILPTAIASPIARSRFATLGVRLAPPALRRAALPDGVRPTASGFAVRLAAPGEYVLTVRAPGARTVELSGDFSAWQPIALREVAVGRWEATVHMAPGTHRCNVRIDGDRWIAPAGTTPVDDDFNGRVGLIVAP